MNNKIKYIAILTFVTIIFTVFALNNSKYFDTINKNTTTTLFHMLNTTPLNENTTTTEAVIITEHSVKRQNFILRYIGRKTPRKITKFKECPQSRILTVMLAGQLGNVIWEYMSLIAVEDLYSDHSNVQAFLPGNMKKILELLFESITTPQIVDLPAACVSVRHAQIIKRTARPQFYSGMPYDAPIVLDAYSCRYEDVIHYGFDNIKNKLRFRRFYTQKVETLLNEILANFNLTNQEDVTFIGVHYRGGDYVNELNKYYRSQFKGPPTYRFYMNAMEYFDKTMENVIFLMVSTDKSWLRKNVPFLKGFNIVVNPSTGERPFINDFILLSLCKHSIINYGTYGTATALFAGGTTLVYDLKLPRDETGYTLATNIAQILPNWFLCNENDCFVN